MIDIKVRFTKKVFTNPDGFSIYGATPTLEYKDTVELSNYGNITISGEYTVEDKELNNKVFSLSIEEDLGSRYPNSYKMVRINYELPKEPEEQWDFLMESNLVTPIQYINLQDKFSSKTKILDLILNDYEALAEAKGFGLKTAKKLNEKIRVDKYKAVIYANFGKIEGVGPSIIDSIANWGTDIEKSIKLIKENPFELMGFKNIGFETVDNIRKGLGIPQDDKNRILHGMKYFLTQKFQATGNTYMDLNKELNEFAEKLGIYKSTLIERLKDEIKSESSGSIYGLKFFNQYITTRELFIAENIVYKKTKSLMNEKGNILPEKSWKSIVDQFTRKTKMELSDEQNKFLKMVNDEKILILLGPGGSGKSWVTKIAFDSLRKAGKKVGLYAPTARAAKVMTNYVGVGASTIARGLIKYGSYEDDTGTFDDLSGGCDDDVLIIDESSMIDSELMSIVYKAMKPEARIIIIGDTFQLPSVGPGNILYDLIYSIKVPTIEFTKIYRQTEDSGIINVASSLRNGTFNIDEYSSKVDMGEMLFINENDDFTIKNLGLTLYSKLIKKNKVDEIMFLSPTNKGSAGRKNLNREIQRLVNGVESKSQMTVGQVDENGEYPLVLRKDDYITVTKNLYETEDDYGDEGFLINGDIGTISNANSEKVTISIDEQEFTFDKGEIITLVEHMWSTTIHKAQGGQADYVILVLPQRSGFISANMLYTAFTRAKKKCVVIGNFSTLNKASKVYANFNRKTMISMQTRTERREN